MQTLSRPVTPGFLLRFTMPGMLMMIFNSVYTMVDGGFVSRFVGTGALSAVNIVYPAQSLVLAIGIMLATGGSAIVARQMGAGEQRRARESFSLLVLTGAVIGVILGAAGACFPKPLVQLLGANDAILQDGIRYLFWLSVFAPFMILQVMFQFFFSTAGRPNLGLLSTLTGGISNIVLDYVFIVGEKMGIAGAAIATGIGFLLPALMGLAYFFFLRKEAVLGFARPVFRLKTLGQACLNGSSEMVSNLAVSITTLLFNLYMMQTIGEDGVAAMTIVFYAQFLFTAMFFGYTSGAAPLLSFHYGAKNTGQMQKLYRLSMRFVIAASLAAFAASLGLGNFVVGVFAPVGTAVYDLASHGMRLFAFGFLFMGFNIFASGFFTALSNGKVSAALSFLRTLVFIIAAICLLPRLWGVDGIWLAIPVAELLAAILSAGCLFHYRRQYQY